jgi:tetratricopeptide (TPR) repeat protein
MRGRAMSDFLVQIIMFCAGSLIGIAVPLLHKRYQRLTAIVLAGLLVASSLVWAGYEMGIRQGEALATAELSRSPELMKEAAELFYQRGVDGANNGKFDLAIENFEKAAKFQYNPAGNISFRKGLAYFYKKDNDSALAEFNQAIKDKYTSIGEVHFYIGEVYLAKEDYPAAMEEYTRAITTKYEPLGKPYTIRGYTYCKLKEFDQALVDYNKAIELGYADAYRYRGWCYMDQGENELALNSYTDGINFLNSKNIPGTYIYYDRAIALKALGRKDEAIKDFETFMSWSDIPSNWKESVQKQIDGLEQ